MTRLSRFAVRTVVSNRARRHAVFRFALATRIRLGSRSLAAQLDDLLSIRLRRRRESCIAAFLHPAMFRYSRTALVTWSNSLAGIRATASLILRRGLCFS